MQLRTCIPLLLLLSACATTVPSPKDPVTDNPRITNLQRAAQYPWADDGHCAVQEATNEWAVLVERCFHALDRTQVRFRDTERRCPVASTDAATLETLVGICLLTQPELVVGAVIVVGVVVIAVAIKEELEAHERRASREPAGPASQTQPTRQEPSANRTPKPETSSFEDFFPPLPPAPRPRRPECEPVPGPARGGNDPHNKCADKVPNNDFPGLNVFVNGKYFDALDLGTRTLWEVKTDNFDAHSLHSQRFFAKVKLPEIKREARIAQECGYHFIVGVRSAAHRAALIELDRSLNIVVMDWC